MCLRRPLTSERPTRRGAFHIAHGLRIDACAPEPLSGAPAPRRAGELARSPRPSTARRGARP